MAPQRSILDLLVQYAEYHRDPRNIVTHCVGVPLIVFGIGVLLARLHFNVAGLDVTPGWVALALAALWYLSRRGQPTLSLAVSASVGLLFTLAHGVANGSTANWLSWGLASFGAGWFIQFIGHYYEGRNPAFVDDRAGFLVGPLFVTAEALFALGWNKPLLAEIERRAGPTRLRDLAHPA